MAKIKTTFGKTVDATLVSSEDEPYLVYEYTERVIKYNPNYGDNRICICGHAYHRHFDSWEDNEACGCKYCGCHHFVEKKE
jgi:hypothetical protein